MDIIVDEERRLLQIIVFATIIDIIGNFTLLGNR